jgi:putative membrane protein
VRAGRAALPLLLVFVPARISGRDVMGTVVELAILGGAILLGFVSWLVTRWRVEGQDLRIETGVIRRSSLRFPLSQVQAIDVIQPGLARLLGLAELRLRMGGSTGDSARLAYVPANEAEGLRSRLLALAGGGPGERPVVDEHVLVSIPTPRLVGSILLSDYGLVTQALLVAVAVTAVSSPAVATGLIGSGLLPLLAMLTVVWRRFNNAYRLTVAEGPDGLRLRGGLVALTAETIRPGRVQAARLVEPLLWRPFGWCRLEVSVAGKQEREGEGAVEGKQLRAVLPVGSRTLALELLERILPGTPAERLRPPRRARWTSPLQFRYLSWGRNDRYVVTTGGRIRRVTAWVPFEKVQSLRRVEGPAQRRLRLVTVHVDTAGRNVHAALRDRDGAEGDRALAELVALAQAARHRLPRDPDRHAARDDEERSGHDPHADALARAEHERGEADAPEALGRHEGRDDRDRPVEVRLEQADVRDPEEDSRGRERA